MKKKIIIVFGVILIFLIINYISITYLKTGNGYISNKIRHNTPQFLKDNLKKVNNKLKKNFFLFENYKNKVTENEKLNIYIFSLLDKISFFDFEFDSTFTPEGTDYLVTKYHNSLFFEMGPRAYLAKDENNIYIITGSGSLMYLPIKEIDNSKELIFKKINTNFFKLASSRYKNGYKKFVKNILIKNEKIYVSYYKKENDNCYFNSVIAGDLNLKEIEFKNFFDVNECQPYYDDQTQVGGNLSNFKDDLILLTIGDSNSYDRQKNDNPQNINSLIGKIISIDTNNGDFNIISMGHRNPQGLFYDDENDHIYSTEHGPEGGDEINLNKKPKINNVKNFGWAISSYGEHYGSEDKWRVEDLYRRAPLNKSHKKFGFEEPLKYFTPAIGITQIIKNNSFNNPKKENRLYVGSMGWDLSEGDLAIHEIILDKKFNYKSSNIITIGDRVRDFIYLEKQDFFIMYLESSASIAFLKKK